MSEGAFRSWAESFAGTDKELWILESDGDVRLLMSRPPPADDPRNDPRIYHVWDGDKWYYCGKSRSEAYAAYRVRKNKDFETETK